MATERKCMKLVEMPEEYDEDEVSYYKKVLVQEQSRIAPKKGSVETYHFERDCRICYMSLGTGRVIVIPKCKHVLHDQCLISSVLARLTSDYDVIRCPVCEDQTNATHLKESFLKRLLDEAQFQRYLHWEASRNTTDLFYKSGLFKYCKANRCTEVIYTDPVKKPAFNETEDASFSYECRTTHEKFCRKCLFPWHPRILDCDTYHNSLKEGTAEAELMKYLRSKQIGFCARCRNAVEKNEGCNHMTCKLCKYQFCYICAGPHQKCFCKGNKEEWQKSNKLW